MVVSSYQWVPEVVDLPYALHRQEDISHAVIIKTLNSKNIRFI
jgi:hypothetical protein